MNIDNSAKKTGRKNKRRWLRWFVVVMLLLIGGLGGTFYYFIQPERVAGIAEGILEDLTLTDVEIAGGEFLSSEELVLKDITFLIPGLKYGSEKLFHADSITLKFDPWTLLSDKPEISRIQLNDPVLHITEDFDRSMFNYEYLKSLHDKKKREQTLQALPEITVLNGQVIYGEVEKQVYKAIGERVKLNGQMKVDAQRDTRYLIALNQVMPKETKQPRLPIVVQGTFDTKSFERTLEVKELEVDAKRRMALPRMIRDWAKSFDLSGKLTQLNLVYDPVTGPVATVQINDLSLTFPQLSKGDYVSRMHHVNAMMVFDSKGVEIKSLTGEIEGLQYDIKGKIDGYKAESPFRLHLKTAAFDIPEKPRFLVGLPEDVQRVFEVLPPVGRMKVDAVFSKADEKAGLKYEGSAEIISGYGHHFKFPYVFRNCKGRIKFNQDRLEIVELHGDLKGEGKAVLWGTIEPPGADGALDITVDAKNLPFDDYLRNCFEDDVRPAYDLFFDKQKYQELIDRGLIISTEQQKQLSKEIAEYEAVNGKVAKSDDAGYQKYLMNKKKLELPVFDMGGVGDALVKIKKPNGKDAKIVVSSEILVKHASSVVTLFPFPVHAEGGRLSITEEYVEFSDMKLRGPNGGVGSIAGKVVLVEDKNEVIHPEPDIHVHGDVLPVDDLLLNALPAEYAEQIRFIRFNGDVKAHAHILTDAKKEPSFNIQVDIGKATCEPGDTKYLLTDLSGQLKIKPGHLGLVGLKGKHGDGLLMVDGDVLQGEKVEDDTKMKFSVQADDLAIEDELLALVKLVRERIIENRDTEDGVGDGEEAGDDFAKLKEMLREYDPRGKIDANLKLDTTLPALERYELRLRTEAIAINIFDQRLNLTNVTGEILVDPDDIVFKEIKLQSEVGELDLDGRISLSQKHDMKLTIAARDIELTEKHLKLLPKNIREVLTSSKLQGLWFLSVDELRVKPAEEGEYVLAAKGSLNMLEASGVVGLELSNADFVLDFDFTMDSQKAYPSMVCEFYSPRLTISEREVTRLGVTFNNTDADHVITIPKLTGKMYGGAFLADGELDLQKESYQIDAKVTGIDIRQFSLIEEDDLNKDAKTISGKMAASLSVEGVLSESRIRRGRGEMKIYNGVIYDLPLNMGLFKLAYLRLPTSQRFEQAVMDYYILGDVVNIRSLRLLPARKGDMMLTGFGRLNYNTQKIMLELTTDYNRDKVLGDVGQLIQIFRKQLATIYITGTMMKPEIKVRSFDGLIRGWSDVFGSGAKNEN